MVRIPGLTDIIVDQVGGSPLTVFQSDDDLHVALDEDDLIVETCAVGVPGRDGSDGAGLFDGIAGEALSGHRAVRHDEDGQLVHADCATAVTAQAIGITLGAAEAGALASVLFAGEVTEPSWSWTAGPIFLGANGLLTQSAPATGCLVIVGHAAGATRMVVAPRLVAVLG